MFSIISYGPVHTPRRAGFAVSAAADQNADWYLEQWALGEDPPCCAKCAGVRWKPDKIRTDIKIDLAPVILDKGVASCQSIAAMHTGHKRAELIRSMLNDGHSEEDAWAEARYRYRVAFEPQDERYYHVVCYDDGELHDPTVGMKK